MGIIIHKITEHEAILVNDIKDMVITSECSLGIDCSSTCTGLCLADNSGIPLYTVAVKRDAGDDYILYKVKLKNFFVSLFKRFLQIKSVYYEEPFLGYAESSKILLTLRTTIQEIKYENTPRFDYLKFREVSNQTWKKLFLSPLKVPAGKDAQKSAVRKKLEEEYYSCYKDLTQDEVDATAMTLVCTLKILLGDEDAIISSHKVRPFKYEIQFIGADADEDMLDEFNSKAATWKIPKKLRQEAYKLIELNGRGMFNDKVYANMGDDDKVLVLKYDSQKYGNITLEYRIGNLVTQYKYLYAVVWRSKRKAVKKL
jgi:hypothetical protein